MIHTSLIETLYHALRRQKRCPAQILLLIEIFHTYWVERNVYARQQSRFRFPLEHVICCVVIQVEALRIATSAPRKPQVLDRLSKMLSELLEKYVVHYNRQIEIQ